jgi:hypothetical protein
MHRLGPLRTSINQKLELGLSGLHGVQEESTLEPQIQNNRPLSAISDHQQSAFGAAE